MYIQSFTFDKNSQFWSKNRNENCAFLRATEYAINNRFRYAGYIYLNDIYELLGVKWDPKRENPCFLCEDNAIRSGFFFEFDVKFNLDETVDLFLNFCQVEG